MALRFRLLLIVGTALLLMYILFIIYSIQQDRIAMADAEKERCQLLYQAVQSEISSRFYTDFSGEPPGIKSIYGNSGKHFLEYLQHNYGSDYSLYDISADGDQLLFSTTQPDLFPRPEINREILLAGEPFYSHFEDRVFSYVFIPLQSRNQDVTGYLEIVSDHSDMISGFVTKQVSMAFLLAISLLMTGILIMFLMQAAVINPLNNIKNFLRKVSDLDLDTRLPVNGNDEVSEMALHLNQTVDVIRDNMDQLKSSHEQTMIILDKINALVYAADMQTFELLFLNKYGRDIYGDVVGSTCWRVLQKGQESPCSFCYIKRLDELKSGQDKNLICEFRSSYNQRYYEYRKTVIKWFDGREVILAIGSDITERKEKEEQLKFLSLHDSLTGLYNKTYIESELRRLEGGRDYPVAIMVGDLDNLKEINDTYGHHIGDQFIIDTAEVMKRVIRRNDILARVGGDEFVTIMPRTDREAAESIVSRIYSELSSYNEVSCPVPISISFGLAVCDEPEKALDDTLIEADRYMYRQKNERR
ncbi:MAG: diguanylate cyclase [Bacillota bacterium]